MRSRWRRLHPALRALVVTFAVLGAAIAVDTGVRLALQEHLETTVEETLPGGVTGTVDARVAGFSALWQLGTGSFEHVELASDDLTVGGVPLKVRVDGYDVAFGAGPVPTVRVGQLDGSLTISEEALNRFLTIPGAEGGIVLGEGHVDYATSLSLLGIRVDVDIEAIVRVQGDRLVVQATRLEATSGGLGGDAADLLGDAATIAVPICSAQYLPAGIHLRAVDVSTGSVTVSVTANSLTLDEATLTSRGTCR